MFENLVPKYNTQVDGVSTDVIMIKLYSLDAEWYLMKC